MMLKRTLCVGAMLACVAGTSMAQSAKKKTDCTYQATVVAAVQQARLDRVRERNVPAHVAAKATWPERYNTVIPLVTPWVYETKMRDLKKSNLGEAWLEICLQN